MKRKYVLATFVVIGILMVIDLPTLMSECPFFSPAKSCGAPVDTACSGVRPCTCGQGGCHPAAQPSTSAILTLSVVDSAGYINGTSSFAPLTSSFQYQAGISYFIGFELNASNPSGRYGFQMTALNPDSSMAGAFVVTAPSHTYLQDSDGIQYIGHHNAETNFLNWVFVWEAPETNKAVTFYYAYNLADSAELAAGLPEGSIYSGNLQIQSITGINDLSGKISGVEIFPNPTSEQFNLSFTLIQSEVISLNVYSVEGKLVQNLMDNEQRAVGDFNRTFDINKFAPGVYLLKLNVGDASIIKKITKL